MRLEIPVGKIYSNETGDGNPHPVLSVLSEITGDKTTPSSKKWAENQFFGHVGGSSRHEKRRDPWEIGVRALLSCHFGAEASTRPWVVQLLLKSAALTTPLGSFARRTTSQMTSPRATTESPR